jgi:hypothetical protein
VSSASIPLAELDSVLTFRTCRRRNRVRRSASVGGFCTLVDTKAATARLGRFWGAPLGDLVGEIATRGPVPIAERAYVHVLSAPDDGRDAGLGASPGGPFDRRLSRLDELLAIPDDVLRGAPAFIESVGPLVRAARDNPEDAEAAALLGVVLVRRGEVEEGMALLDRARRTDPLAPAVRGAVRGARRILDEAISERREPAEQSR